MGIKKAQYIPQEKIVDGTPVDDQVYVYTENTDGTVTTHLYPQSKELVAWVEEGNTIQSAWEVN